MVTIATENSPILAYYRDKKGKDVPTRVIVKKFGDGTPLTRARIYETIRRLERRNAIERVQKGLYRYKNGIQSGNGDTKQEVMWRLLRIRRTVTIDDLVELAGVSRVHAGQFLDTMIRNEVARKNGDKYSMIKDTVAMPRDEKTAAKKRAARRAAALAAIDNAKAALDDARAAISDMEE
jgi:hypothetical protein